MKRLFFFILALGGLTGLLCGQPTLQLANPAFSVATDSLAGFHRYELVELDFITLNNLQQDRLDFSLMTPRGTVEFSLHRWELRSPSHQLRTSGGKGEGKLIPRAPSAQFRGLTGAGERAVFTFDKLFTKGRWTQEGEKYNLEPLWRLHPSAPRNVYLLYRDSDVKDIPGACATPANFRQEDLPDLSLDKAVGECFEVEIAIASDFEMFQAFGSASSVENFMLGVLADVRTNYDDEFADALTFVVAETIIATSNATDPWTNDTDAFALLPDFGNWANGGGFGAGVSYDVASLWTNRDFDGTTVGLASVGAVCRNSRYNVLQQFSNSATAMRVMWTHELGHNFGSFHDPDEEGDPVWIMSPFVSSSAEWSPQSINAIQDYYASVSCLSNCPVPEPPAAQSSVFLDNVCAGSLVSFFDDTQGRVNSRQWTFPGGSPASSTEIAPIVTYAEPGTYQAFLTVENQFGQDQTQLTVVVAEASLGAPTVLFYENFEGAELDVNIVNPDGRNTWFLATADGNQGNVGIRVNNFDNDLRGQVDVMELPPLDLSGVTNPTLEFEYAYHRYSPTLSDRLRVLANTGDGDVLLFEGQENGSQNFATGPDNEARFVPGSGDDWCFAGPGCIRLSLADLGDLTNVVLKIENINGYGNLMWVDNIAVTGDCTSNLPVEWLAFTARAQDKVSKLDWRVVQEAGHLGFTVERRTNGTSWTEIDWIPAKASTSASVNYGYTDTDVAAGATYYYRLRQQDQDGSSALSEVRSVTFAARNSLAVWPNPTGGSITIDLPGSTEPFSLFNTFGQVLHTGVLQDGRAALSLEDLAAGIYLVRIGKDQVVRVVKR